MSCCPKLAAARQVDVALPVDRSVSPALDAQAEPVARIRFAAGQSHVGSNRPVLVQDGEGPARTVRLAGFTMEAVTVSNARFAAFVAATGHVTEAERFGWSPVFRGLMPDGSAHAPIGAGLPWWLRVDGACWHQPEGPGSTLAGREHHPVVQVSWHDAQAFAQWCGGRLPTEAEWEHAARGGLADPRFPWGDAEPDDQQVFCNIWQGRFPDHNSLADGFLGTAPVDSYAPNGAGLFNMVGNVWEWTADPFRIRSLGRMARRRNEQAARDQEKLAKGGSFLCHSSYCYRYRIAARTAMSADSATSHAGFRICYD